MQIRQPASQPDVGWTKHVISFDVFLTFSRMPRTECYFSEPFSIIVGPTNYRGNSATAIGVIIFCKSIDFA